MKRGFLPAIPFLGYIIALLLGAASLWASANILNFVKLTIVEIGLIFIGLILVGKALLTWLDPRKASWNIALAVAVIGVLMVLAGLYLPQLGLSITGGKPLSLG